MPLIGGEIRLHHTHDGRVARLTLANGPYTIITWEMREIPGSGGTQRLARLIGLSRAKYHVFRGARVTAA